MPVSIDRYVNGKQEEGGGVGWGKSGEVRDCYEIVRRGQGSVTIPAHLQARGFGCTYRCQLPHPLPGEARIRTPPQFCIPFEACSFVLIVRYIRAY